MANNPQIRLGDPIVVAQGPAEVRGWGPWQFPNIERLGDGRLHLTHHMQRDSAKDYGLPMAHYTSADDGRTWTPTADVGADGGLILPNGDHLRQVVLRTRPVEELQLPAYCVRSNWSYGNDDARYYRVTELPAELQGGWHFARLTPGATTWTEERASVSYPGELRHVHEKVLVFPWFWHMTVAPDGSLWGLHQERSERSKTFYAFHPIIMRSTDHGHTWDLLSEIFPYHDPSADPHWDLRDGYFEPDVAFMPDGSVFCLLRTTDGNGPGPLYWTRSTDGGRHWSHPALFDTLGVKPVLLSLANGVTLAAYGRPGLYVRASADGAGLVWGERTMIMPPDAVQTNTCSYAGMVALDDKTALLAYSDFNYPDAAGTPRKTILVRPITTG